VAQQNVQPSVKHMFPGRFLEAEDIGDKVVTVTIGRPYNDPELAKALGKPFANILTFAGKKKELLLNVTNASLIEAMFPGDPNKIWPGKRVCLRRASTKLMGDVVPCIRVYGSPDLSADKKVPVRMGLQVQSVTLRAFKAGEKQDAPPSNDAVTETDQQQSRSSFEADPAIEEAWSALGWTKDEGQKHMEGFIGDKETYFGSLSVLIDQMNAQESA
jgi:hypothetical protein